MSSIKERITKKCHSDPRVTIDTLHCNLIDDLSKKKIKCNYYLDNGLLLDSYYSRDIDQSSSQTKTNCRCIKLFSIK